MIKRKGRSYKMASGSETMSEWMPDSYRRLDKMLI